ncbi:MAG: hypothetical protein CPDRYMAC_5568 [uncultured Paraburkholderia sp.]|nr:MAG: hypothetical protein CPDRYDRY_5483 [uncultured Paraburkholderia sp.]CAH2941362.1 MAG: hypothetical protein CPDRYMAC_5568 [uncultured Paraburkholderia sp.]
MSVAQLVAVAALCLLLVSCSRANMFGRAPTLRVRTELAASRVAACVESRWKKGARHLHSTHSGDVIRLRAEAFFTGIAIGVRLSEASGKTRVEYFERRSANAVYEAMVRECTQADTDASNGSVVAR